MRRGARGRPARDRANTRFQAVLRNLGVQRAPDRGSADSPPRVQKDVELRTNVAPEGADGDGGDREDPGNSMRVSNEVLNSQHIADAVLDRDRVSAGGSSSSPLRGFRADDDLNLNLEIRKRRLDLEIEESRAKLRLIEAERRRLDLDVARPVISNIVRDLPPAAVASTPPEGTDTRENELMSKMVQMLSEAIKGSQQSGVSANVVNRLVSQKESLVFSGNSLEWLRFKRAFEQSTESGGYTDRENVIRLYNCLKGEARESVESLMLTCESADQILKSLELRFGSKDIAIRKLLNNLRDLPRLRSGDIDLIAFASEVKNNVVALNSLGNSYLFNPDLIADLLRKIPESMVYRYNEYAARNSSIAPNLSTFAEFLSYQAEIANQAGTTFVLNPQRIRRREHRQEKPVHTRRVNSISGNHRSRSPIIKQKAPCIFCNCSKHETRDCRKFQNLDIPARWKWVRREKLCFNCLGSGHFGRQCRESGCRVRGCRVLHHSLLHSVNSGKDKRTNGESSKTFESNTGNSSNNQ